MSSGDNVTSIDDARRQPPRFDELAFELRCFAAYQVSTTQHYEEIVLRLDEPTGNLIKTLADLKRSNAHLGTVHRIISALIQHEKLVWQLVLAAEQQRELERATA